MFNLNDTSSEDEEEDDDEDVVVSALAKSGALAARPEPVPGADPGPETSSPGPRRDEGALSPCAEAGVMAQTMRGCVRNPLCTRGYLHGGRGGLCSVPRRPRPRPAVFAPPPPPPPSPKSAAALAPSTVRRCASASWRARPLAKSALFAPVDDLAAAAERLECRPPPPSPTPTQSSRSDAQTEVQSKPSSVTPYAQRQKRAWSQFSSPLDVDFEVLACRMGAVEAAVARARARLDAGIAPLNNDRAFLARLQHM